MRTRGRAIIFGTPSLYKGRSEERRVGKECRSRWSRDQAEDGIRDGTVTGVQTCALPILPGQPLADEVADALGDLIEEHQPGERRQAEPQRRQMLPDEIATEDAHARSRHYIRNSKSLQGKIGRASCRERV